MPFLATLDVVAFIVDMKMKYHNDFGKLVVISANLHGAYLIYETILKNPLVTIIALEKEIRRLVRLPSIRPTSTYEKIKPYKMKSSILRWGSKQKP